MTLFIGIILFAVGIVSTRSQLVKFKKDFADAVFENVLDTLLTHYPTILWSFGAIVFGFAMIIVGLTS